MDALSLENALRKIANSGDSRIVYNQAGAFENILSAKAMEELTDFLEELVEDFESKNGVTLKV